MTLPPAPGQSDHASDGSGPRGRADPAAAAAPDLERVRRVVDRLRPHVQADGGDIELIGVEPGGVVKVRMLGSCHGCPSSEVTLASSLERNLKGNVPGVTGVRVVA